MLFHSLSEIFVPTSVVHIAFKPRLWYLLPPTQKFCAMATNLLNQALIWSIGIESERILQEV